ncbi:MAG: hypothetical protein V3T70_04910, partial [Phycisphaerae bacterium]
MTPNRLGVGRLVLMGVMVVGASVVVGGGCDLFAPPVGQVPPGDRPPTVQITAPITDVTVDPGDTVTIGFRGEDGESQSRITLFVDADQDPTNGNEIILRDDLFVGPGQGSGSFVWDTEGVPADTYLPFARIDDGVNPPVLSVGLAKIQVVPGGTSPSTEPPEFEFDRPLANLGLSSGDTVTLRYRYRDSDSPVKITFLLDKDQDPTNDDVNNPGDPFDPATNIIILPSAPRKLTDPVLDPDVPGQPPANIDSIEIRTNPRTYPPTGAGQPSTLKLYVFDIDFSQIPLRANGLPYFLRATIDDDDNPPEHFFAVGSLTLTGLAAGFVDVRDIGSKIAGAKFHGFSANARLGTSIIDAGDSDNDTVNDFMLAGRFASPRHRFSPGGAYLIRGRRKLPFPPDTNTNGLPDEPGAGGVAVDFPAPPLFINPPLDGLTAQTAVALPYEQQNVGRFGGVNSINSVGSFFRGITFGMPEAHGATRPPVPLRDSVLPNQNSAGLTSIAQLDLTGDGIVDFVFGLPFISGARDYHDDDPCDGDGAYLDGYPNSQICSSPPDNEDLGGPGNRNFTIIDQGMVI